MMALTQLMYCITEILGLWVDAGIGDKLMICYHIDGYVVRSVPCVFWALFRSKSALFSHSTHIHDFHSGLPSSSLWSSHTGKTGPRSASHCLLGPSVSTFAVVTPSVDPTSSKPAVSLAKASAVTADHVPPGLSSGGLGSYEHVR